MTYQLVNILEYLIPEWVETYVQRLPDASSLDGGARQQIVLQVLNAVHPCYQLLSPEAQSLLSSLNQVNDVAASKQAGNRLFEDESFEASSRCPPLDNPDLGSDRRHSSQLENLDLDTQALPLSKLEGMLPPEAFGQIRAAIAEEVAMHLASISFA